MLPRSLQLLEQLLTGQHLAVNELDELINTPVKEDLYLEYKHGDELLNRDANDTIREYISGFANSAGGILIVGVEAAQGAPSRVTGCHGHNKGNLDEWAARCLTPIASYFSPLPQFQVLPHPSGDVLIGITQRSLGLVPRTEAGGIVYHFRFHDQTLKAPDYLMADLLLGRRQQPVIGIADLKIMNLNRILDNSIGAMDLEFEMRVQLENQSIVWADGSRWGLIAWVQQTDNRFNLDVSQPSSHLLSFVEARDIQPERYSRSRRLLHLRGITHIDKPFDVGHLRMSLSIPLRIHNEWFSYNWRAALYLIARNSLPIWYQINLAVKIDTASLIDQKVQLTGSNGGVRLTRLINERPIVDWEGF